MGLLDKLRVQGAAFRLTEELLFAEVLREMESGVRRDGLWAKALSLSDMDTTRAHAIYIKLRVQSLRDEIDAIRAAQVADERTRRATLEHTKRTAVARDAESERVRRARVNEEAERRLLRLAAENGYTVHARSSKWIVADLSSEERFDTIDDAETYIRNVAMARAAKERSTTPSEVPSSTGSHIFLNFVRWRDMRGAAQSLERDASLVHAVNADGKTAIHLATIEGDADMVAMLLDHGADPDRRDDFGTTAREVALRHTHMSVLRVMETHPNARAP